MPLLLSRRLLPLLATQALGAFQDHLVKTAVLAAAVFGAAGMDPGVAGGLAGVLLAMPFLLLSGRAGLLADRLDKAAVARATKALEIPAAGVAAAGFLLASPWLLFGAVLLLGIQSALFSPAKYSLLPAHLQGRDLVAGNAWMEATTFGAILAGTIAGGLLAARPEAAAVLCIATAATGLLAALAIPKAPPHADAPPALAMRAILAAPATRTLVLLQAWFWSLAATWMALLAGLTRGLGGAEEAFVSLLALFTVGVAAGALLLRRLAPLPGLAPAAAAAALLVPALLLEIALRPETLADGIPLAWAAALAALAAAAGAFGVPTAALLQHAAPAGQTARHVAAANVAATAGVVASGAAVAALSAAGVGIADLLLGTALLHAALLCAWAWSSRRPLLQAAGRALIRAIWRPGIRGALPEGACVVAPNHPSMLDGALVAALLREPPVVAIDDAQSKRWWVRILLSGLDWVAIDGSPRAWRRLRAHLDAGRQVLVFPEGRLSRDGGPSRAQAAPAALAHGAGVPLVPVGLDGPERLRLFAPDNGHPRRWRPAIRAAFLPPRNVPAFAGAPQARRVAQADWTDQALEEARFEAGRRDAEPLFPLLAEGLAARRGVALEDAERRLGGRQALAGAFALARHLPGRPGDRIGVLLPTSVPGALAILACWAAGRVAVPLNFTAGPAAVAAHCQAAGVSAILTSPRLLARLRPDLLPDGIPVVHLEQMRARIGAGARMRALLDAWTWRRAFRRLAGPQTADAWAAIPATSGSEGAPKGVVLTQAALVAQVAQIRAAIAVRPDDAVLAALPLFHAFGLMAGLVLPAALSVRAILHPNPLDRRAVPALAHWRDASVVFGADTFLRQWAEAADPHAFRRVRLAVAGAERLSDATRARWQAFGATVLEGYGMTEAAPVVAVQRPGDRPGAVGRPLPGMEIRLAPVEGVEGGRLLVRGPNLFAGYLRAEAPLVLDPPAGGWHDTGDAARLGQDGALALTGRLKRFAKSGGEMISLDQIEAALAPLGPVAAVALPDARRGEAVALAWEGARPDAETVRERLRSAGLPEIAWPRLQAVLPALPRLPAGKTDLRAVAAALAAA